MKPRISILNRAFAYRPSYATAIAETWRRFGWRPVKRDVQEPQPQAAQAQPRVASVSPRTWRSERATFAQSLHTWQKKRATSAGGSL